MGQRFKVRFLGATNERAAAAARDCTVGTVYEAEYRTAGSVDTYGCRVADDCFDAITLVDDVGDVVEAKLSSGFEIVEETTHE